MRRVVLLLVLIFAVSVFGASLEDANRAYVQSLLDLENLKQNQFPTRSVEDAIVDMRDALKGISVEDLKEKARIFNASGEQEKMLLAISLFQIVAESERTGLKPGVNYSYVVERASWVKEQHDSAFVAYDLLVRQTAIVDSLNESLDLSVVRASLQEAFTAFSQERFKDVVPIVERVDSELEDARVEAARERAFLKLARRNLVDFIRDNWISLLIALILVSALSTLGFFEFRVRKTKEHIKNLKIHLIANRYLQKTSQEEYYSGHIGAHLYKGRMDRYRHSERDLKKEIRVYEQLLRDYNNVSLVQRFQKK